MDSRLRGSDETGVTAYRVSGMAMPSLSASALSRSQAPRAYFVMISGPIRLVGRKVDRMGT